MVVLNSLWIRNSVHYFMMNDNHVTLVYSHDSLFQKITFRYLRSSKHAWLICFSPFRNQSLRNKQALKLLSYFFFIFFRCRRTKWCKQVFSEISEGTWLSPWQTWKIGETKSRCYHWKQKGDFPDATKFRVNVFIA